MAIMEQCGDNVNLVVTMHIVLHVITIFSVCPSLKFSFNYPNKKFQMAQLYTANPIYLIANIPP